MICINLPHALAGRITDMHVAVFSTKPYDRTFLEEALSRSRTTQKLLFLESQLNEHTVAAAAGAPAVCVFVNDVVSAPVLRALQAQGTRLVVLRCAGFNNVDLRVAEELGITVCRVPEYSPWSVAEHAVALALALNRKLPRAHARVRESNFALEGLLGFDMHGKTVGVIGTGKIGAAFARIMAGFGCTLLAHDPQENAECRALGALYVSLDELLTRSHIISLHCPLTPATRHVIDEAAVRRMQRGVMLINTSRGAVVDTRALIAGLKSGVIGALGLDVYEEEGDLFYRDLSGHILQDDVFARLLTFPNVLITAHQGFFTHEALTAIADITIGNITHFEETGKAMHEVSTERLA